MVNASQLSKRALLAALPAVLAGCATRQSSPGYSSTAEGFGPLAGFPTAPIGPPLPSGPLGMITISSCSNEELAAPLYSDIRALKPDLALMIGDNVYGSRTPEDPQLSDLRAAYWQMARRQEFRELVANVPTLAVWDDHDFGKNDGGGDFPQKALAQAMFNTFWNIPSTDPLRSRPGLYRSMTVGPVGQRVQIIMLDTRYFRDPLRPTDQRDAPGRERYIPHPPDATNDVLGASQWAWLERTLQEPAELRIIASSIQVIADGHGYERWGQFPAALARLYRLVGTSSARGVVFVSGDRHLAAINRRDDVVGYALHDLTASAINTSNWRQDMPTDTGEAGPYRLGPSYTPSNYGRIAIDWTRRVLKLEVVGVAGLVALTAIVPFTSLGL